MSSHAQCLGAGHRFCADCRRNVDNNPPDSRGPYQVFVSPTTTNRCAHWLAMPPVKRAAAEQATRGAG